MKRFEMIKDKTLFNDIIRHGRYIKDNNYVIYTSKSQSENIKFGIAIKKNIGSAVTRNRLKRQTRAIIDKNRNIFKNSYNYIIMIRDGCLTSSFGQMNESIINLMKGKNE